MIGAEPSFYLTGGGAEIDLVLTWADGREWAIEMKRNPVEAIGLSALRPLMVTGATSVEMPRQSPSSEYPRRSQARSARRYPSRLPSQVFRESPESSTVGGSGLKP